VVLGDLLSVQKMLLGFLDFYAISPGDSLARLQWHRSVAHTIALFPSPFPSAARGGRPLTFGLLCHFQKTRMRNPAPYSYSSDGQFTFFRAVILVVIVRLARRYLQSEGATDEQAGVTFSS